MFLNSISDHDSHDALPADADAVYAEWCRGFWKSVGVGLGYGGETVHPGQEHRRFGRWHVRLSLTMRMGEPRVCVRCDESSPSSFGLSGGLVLLSDRLYTFDRDPKSAALDIVRDIRSGSPSRY